MKLKINGQNLQSSIVKMLRSMFGYQARLTKLCFHGIFLQGNYQQYPGNGFNGGNYPVNPNIPQV